VATISDFRHVAKRLAGDAYREPGRLRRLAGFGQPDEHVLEITAPVTVELRVLLIAAAASLYLALQWPLQDGD
jgi:hypothetical protein